MELFAQLVFMGCAEGSVYALIAMTFGLIVYVTRVFHLAHGAVLAIAAYSIHYFTRFLGFPVWASVLFTFPISALFGILMELGIYRPLERKFASPLILLLASLAILFGIPGVLGIFFSTDAQVLLESPMEPLTIGKMVFKGAHLGMLTLWIFIGLLLFYLRHSQMGKTMRAVADRPEMAEIVGINTSRARLMATVIGSALLTLPAFLIYWGSGITPGMGFMGILFASAGAILGGMGSILGAAFGGLTIGLLVNLGVAFISTRWQVGIAFSLLVLVLLLRPEGIFGTRMKW
jgi:branched-subunit amino acid ABC-type transport system permease component